MTLNQRYTGTISEGDIGMLFYEKRRLPIYPLLVAWLVMTVLIFSLPRVLPRIAGSRIATTAVVEAITLLVIWLVNRYWVRASLHFRSPLSVSQQLRGTWPAVLLLVFFAFAVIVKFPQGVGAGKVMVRLVLALLAAGLEETVFRGIILGGLLQRLHLRLTQRLWVALIGNSLLFSLSHLMNLTHQSLPATLMQVIQAFGLGLVLSALYLRTGSLLWSMLFHFGLDATVMIAALTPHAGAGSVSMSELMPFVVYLVITLILLWPSRWQTIDFRHLGVSQ